MEVEERAPPIYSMASMPPPTDANPESTSTVVSSTKATSKATTTNTRGTAHTSTGTPLRTTSTKPTSTPTPAGSFKFVELFSGDASAYYSIHEDTFLNTSFDALCPSGNCITDCQDYPRLFSALPSGIDQNVADYGRLDANGKLQVTLFGVCSNLGNATAAAQAQGAQSAIHQAFAVTDGSPSENITRVATTIASCFENTCSETRDPSVCHDACSAAQMLLGGAAGSSLDVQGSMMKCVHQLCENTCGLPYADQDIMGIGVLVSYYVQALLVLLIAAAMVGVLAWRLWKRKDGTPHVHWRLKKPLDSFLRAQAYFGASAAVASFVMHPSTVDPLNGYALLSVAITGFLPVVFSLMLLHNHGVRSWFSTALVFISWLLNTVVFFMLFKNLSNSQANQVVFERGLNNLFSTPACGYQSAMSLCQQLRGTNPLSFLAGFFNQGTIPNIKTVPILWGWSSFCLFALIARQALGLGGNARNNAGHEGYDINNGEKGRSGPTLLSFAIFLAASLLFSLCLGYQYVMVRAYQLMDVIDYNGWSFGQVVAVMFWVPPALEVFQSMLDSKHSIPGRAQFGSHGSHTPPQASVYAPLTSQFQQFTNLGAGYYDQTQPYPTVAPGGYDNGSHMIRRHPGTLTNPGGGQYTPLS